MKVTILNQDNKLNTLEMDRTEYFNITSGNHKEEVLKYHTNLLITKIKKSLNENRDEQELFDTILSIVKYINTLNTMKGGSKKRRHD
jgi:hypothetical protein